MPSPRHAPPSPFQEALWGFSCFLWSLWRAPKEQLAGCQQWGPLKGARWRMLGAKKCKQVDPLHYMGPPLHSHTPPSTVFFYVAVFHKQIYTQSNTHRLIWIPPPTTAFFFQDCVFSKAISLLSAVGWTRSQTASHISPGCLFHPNIS